MTDKENFKSVAETSFKEAEDHFKDWLAGRGLSSDLLWIFREDVLFLDGRIYLRTPIDADNHKRAKAFYELAQARNFGVGLHGFCLLEDRICCYQTLPEDDIDAQYKLMSNVGVKYSYSMDLSDAVKISSGIIWRIRSWQSLRRRFTNFEDEIPSRYILLTE